MRDFFLRSVVVVGLVVSGLASSILRGQVVADPEQVDLGKQEQNKVLETEVRLTNKGEGTVEITGVYADCSCTAGKPEKSKLQPGESTKLKITLETRTYSGPLERRVHVQTSENEFTIPVKTEVYAFRDWHISPSPAVLPVGRGAPVSGEITFRYDGEAAVELLEVQASRPWVKAELQRKDDRIWVVKVGYTPNAPAGNHSERLLVRTSDASQPELAVVVFIPIRSTLRVNPNPLILPTTKIGERATASLVLSGWAGKEAPGVLIQGGDAQATAAENGDWKIEVSATPDKVGANTLLLQVFNDDGVQIEIPVMARGEP